MKWRLASLHVLALLLAGCQQPVAFTVNGEGVSVADVNQAARITGRDPSDPALLEEVVRELLLRQDAERLGLRVASEAVEEALAQATRDAGGPRALRRRLADHGLDLRAFEEDLRRGLLLLEYTDRLTVGVGVSDEEVRVFFEEQRPRFLLPERWRVFVLRYPDQASASQAREALAAGEDPESLVGAAGPESGATELSRAQTGPERMALLEAIRSVPFGTPSPILILDGDFIVAFPYGYLGPSEPTFEELLPTLRAQLDQRAGQTALARHLEELRSRATIEWREIEPAAP